MKQLNELHKKLEHLLRNKNHLDHQEFHDDNNRFNLGAWISENFPLRTLEQDTNGNIVIRDFVFEPTTPLDNIAFVDITLVNCSLANCDLSNTQFDQCEFQNVDTNNSTFHGAHFQDHIWYKQTVSNTDFSNATFVDCQIAYSNFSHCLFNDAQFLDNSHSIQEQKARDQYYKVDYQDCNFDGANFKGMLLNHYQFKDCSMINSRLDQVVLRGTNFMSYIEQSTFEDVSAMDAIDQPNLIQLGPSDRLTKGRTLISSLIKNSALTTQRFEIDSPDASMYLHNNTLSNNQLNCAELILDPHGINPKNFTGVQLNNLLQTLNRPANQTNNDFSPQESCGMRATGMLSFLSPMFPMVGLILLITLGVCAYQYVLKPIMKCREACNNRVRDDEVELLELQNQDNDHDDILNGGYQSLLPSSAPRHVN